MDVLILNRQFQTEAVIDAFESFIWTDRYRTPGDTELYMPVEKAPLESIREQHYLWRRGTDRLMIIEDILIETDAESGPHLTVTGRSLESILERRIVSKRTIINGNLQNGIRKLLNENAISPRDTARRIPGLRFIINNDPKIKALTCELNLLGEDLLSVVEDLCEVNDLGFKISYNESLGTFDFMLYYGEDRSYNQDKNPWIVFSSNYDNLLKTSYYESSKNLRTAAVIAGSESDSHGQEIVDVNGKPNLKGLDRREMFVEASGIQRPETEVNEDSIRARMEEDGEEETAIQEAIADAWLEANAQDRETYRRQLKQAGKEELAKTYITQSFEGEIEAVRQYIYDRDFFLGDVVQVQNEYGKEGSSRITEVIMSHDVDGETLTPTFTSLIGGDNLTME